MHPTATVLPLLHRRLPGWLSASLLSLLLASCAPGKVLTTGAPAPPDPIAQQAASLVSHPDSVYVRFRFVRAQAQELVFEAEFSNAANHPVRIDPARFYYLARPDSAAPTLAPDSTARNPVRHWAADPETRLDSLASRRDELADKASRVSALEIFALLANVALDVASTSRRETPRQAANSALNRAARYQSTQAVFAMQRLIRADKAHKLNSTVQELAASSLRRATLQPGYRAVGLVYFPLPATARQLRFVLAFDEQPVPFDFNLKLQRLGSR